VNREIEPGGFSDRGILFPTAWLLSSERHGGLTVGEEESQDASCGKIERATGIEPATSGLGFRVPITNYLPAQTVMMSMAFCEIPEIEFFLNPAQHLVLNVTFDEAVGHGHQLGQFYRLGYMHLVSGSQRI
jgi:hypothetical protein